MSFLKDIWFRIGTVLGRHRYESVMEDEMAFHLDMAIREKVDQGMDPVVAKKQALKEFGSVESLKEDCRDSWGVRVALDLFRDLRFGLRRLKKSPGFTVIAIISLGIAIGANTAIFSMLNALLFRSLPVSNPQELREVRNQGSNPQGNVRTRGSMRRMADGQIQRTSFNYASFSKMQEVVGRDVGQVFGFASVPATRVSLSDQMLTMPAMMVSGNCFEGLGIGTILGRSVRPEDDVAGATPVAVISYGLWQRSFEGSADVIGELVRINDIQFRIVGVLTRHFYGPVLGSAVDLYIPMVFQPGIQMELSLSDPLHFWILVMARLNAGVPEEQLRTLLDVALQQTFPAEMLTDSEKPLRAVLFPGSAGPDNDRAEAAMPFLVLLGGAGIVLLAACANLAGLLTARGIAQQPEMATRAALGAGRWRLVRQSLTECLLLAGLGAGFGWLLSIWGKVGILQVIGLIARGVRIDVSSDLRVFAFVTALTLLATVSFGLLPSLRVSRTSLMSVLRTSTLVEARRSITGRVLVGLQVGLALFLVVGAGLLIRSLVKLQNTDPGYNLDKLLVFKLDAKNAGYEGRQKLDFYQNALDAVREVPGVKAVACSDLALLAGMRRTSAGFRTGAPNEEIDQAEGSYIMGVSTDFLHTMELPLLRGRFFEATDVEDSEPVMVVNETFVRQYFGNEDPVGRTIQNGEQSYRIVGVVANFKYHSLKMAPRSIVIYPLAQLPTGPFGLRRVWVEVRTQLDPMTLVPAVRDAVASVNPNVPLDNIKTQAIQMNESIFLDKFFAALVSAFAILGVFLSCIGVYGLMAYMVSRRTAEIGIRKALGAGESEAMHPILNSSFKLAGVGLIFAAIAVLPLGGVIKRYLFQVEPYDPMTIVAGICLLLLASYAAAWFPARKAARISPMEALRVE